MALVGETGCGKSTIAHSIIGILPYNAEVKGQILFKNLDLMQLGEKELAGIRGKEISLIMQNPALALNPVYTIGNQIAEAIIVHQHLGKKEAWDRAIHMLGKVGIPGPHQRAGEYPHQLSGGMRQRAMIAMALSCHPALLIADDPDETAGAP